jgi:hypothetical protein
LPCPSVYVKDWDGGIGVSQTHLVRFWNHFASIILFFFKLYNTNCDSVASSIWHRKKYPNRFFFNNIKGGIIDFSIINNGFEIILHPSFYFFLIFLFEWEYVSFMMVSCIFWIGLRNGWVSYLNYAVHIYCKLTLYGYILQHKWW